VGSSDFSEDESPDEPAELVGDESDAELDSEPEGGPDDDESDGEESDAELVAEAGSAHATPGAFATAAPIPRATANAPIRPIYVS
jgi:hypothetical protein